MIICVDFTIKKVSLTVLLLIAVVSEVVISCGLKYNNKGFNNENKINKCCICYIKRTNSFKELNGLWSSVQVLTKRKMLT